VNSALKRSPQAKPANKIVGIGASAGGLEAFTELLRSLPLDADAAYVLVQHLDPSHRSLLSELLSKATALRVREITDNTPVEANQIYVIPPNCDLAITQGILKLSPREKTGGAARSIDNFLTSLAADQNENAIAVILSGAGSDGAQGLRAVKAAGGITFAQDDRTAKYDSMPRAAVATGCVDFVLPPPDIAKELARVIQTPKSIRSRAAANAKRRRTQPGGSRVRFGRRAAASQAPVSWPVAPQDPSLRKIFQLLRAKTGLDFTFYKSNTIRRRLARRLALNKVKELEEYLKVLRQQPVELEALHQDLLINVTSFFRNPAVFETLKRKIFPQLVRNLSGADTLRIWVAGCSTGQEAYSIAMAYTEFADKADVRVPLQIFASDVNGSVLEFARAGCYSKADVSMVGSARLQRFFTPEEGQYRVQKAVRDLVIFAQHNLLQDPPFTRVDLITCRNMLIYFDPALQQKIIPAFHYALKPDGFLVLGSSESVGQFHNLFETVEKTHRVYSKKPASNWPRFERPPAITTGKRGAFQSSQAVEVSGADLQKEADRLVLQKYSPPGVLINSDGEVLQFRGDMERYLKLPTGKATFQILKMAQDSLAIALERVITKAKREKKVVREKGVRVDQRRTLVDLEVVPLKLRAQCYLVLFQKHQPRLTSHVLAPSRKAGRGSGDTRQLIEVKQELSATRDHLNSLQEEHDTSIEELQASNEEVQSANEELQSLNEELETSNEELESANEELTTLNEELATRNSELRESETRLREQAQLLEMAPLLARSPKDRIVLWSRGAEEMYGYAAEEAVGQTAHILLDTQTPEPMAKIQSKLQATGHWEGEVTHRRKDGRVLHVATHWVAQYDDQKKIRAILEVNTDITERKAAEKALADSEEFNRTVLDSSPDCIKVLDLDGRVVFVNPAGRKLLETGDSEVRAKPYWPGLWEGEGREAAEKSYRAALTGKGSRFVGFRVTPRGTPKWWDVVVRPIVNANGAPDRLLAVLRDITEHRNEQAAVVERARLAVLRAEVAMETTSDGPMQTVLQQVSEALLKRLGLALVRAWTLEENGDTLVLRASAGLYGEIDGTDSRITVGFSTIGRVAERRQISINNHVQSDAENLDGDWLRREQVVSLGAYPLIVADRVVGVLAVYGRQTLSEAVASELVLASKVLAQFIQRKQAEEKLRAAQDELSRYTGTLEKLTEERTSSLREVVQQMEEFSYTISHDLRAPVRAMQGYANAILEDYGTQLDQTGREYLDRIVRSGDRMDRMIREVLTYSRLARCEIAVQPVPLDALVREIVQQYPGLQSAAGEIEIVNELDSVMGHEPSLTQVISNLLSNACKFVAPKSRPRCKIWTERTNGHVRLFVRDNGIGIKPEHQHRLFGLFERIHPESQYEGTGIGLAIVRKAMERMGGQVGMESDGINGSQFWIQLPAVVNDQPSKELDAEQDRVKSFVS
jgi:two-component system CheB/CheR fusion protein